MTSSNEIADGNASPVPEELDDSGLGSGIEAEDIDAESAEIEHPFDPKEINIHTRPFTVSEVLERLENREINLTPDFQRQGGIWKYRSKSRLIESMLLRIPLPVFYVHQDSDEDWLVVDGLQRITTIKEFALDKKMRLGELEFLTQFNGLGFDDLPRPMQRRLKETSLLFHLILPSTPKAVTRTIFRRINTGGLPLSAQEIRHALYQGPATRLLIDLVQHPSYLAATTNSIRDTRMGGREAILRFLAFYWRGVSAYADAPDMDTFLSDTLDLLNSEKESTLRKLSNAFVTAMDRSEELFGRFAFRKRYGTSAHSWRYPISKPLFEVWSVNLAQLGETDYQLIAAQRQTVVQRFVDLMTGKYKPFPSPGTSFDNAISLSTGGLGMVEYRFNAVKKLLENLLEEAPNG